MPALLGRDHQQAEATGGSDPPGEDEHATWQITPIVPPVARPAESGPRRSGAVAVSVVLKDPAKPAPLTTGIGPRRARLPKTSKVGRRTIIRDRMWPVQPPHVHGPIWSLLIVLLFLAAMLLAVGLGAHLAGAR